MTSLDTIRLAASIDRLYEAALTPDLWSDALSALAASAGGFAANLVYGGPDASGWIICSPEIAAAWPAYVRENWAPHNFRINLATQEVRAAHPVITEATLLSDREMDRQPIQAGFFAPHDMRHFIGFEMLPGEIFAGIERGNNPAAEWELDAIRKALPHFKRIGRLAQARGQARADGALDALSHLNHAALLIDRNGLVIHMNAAAETLLPTAFQITQSVLRPLHQPSQSAVQELLTAAAAPLAPHETPCLAEIAVPRLTGGRLILQAAPLAGAARDIFRRAKAVVLLLEPGRALPVEAQRLRRLFGLTAAEARLAQRLAQGEDLESIAAALAISRSTARTHLARIFIKTGTNRQAELAALLARIFARLGG